LLGGLLLARRGFGVVHDGQRAGELDTADGHRDDGSDLDDQQPPAGADALVKHGDPVGRADQGVAQGQRRLDRDERAGLQGVLQQEQRADPGYRGAVELPGGQERDDALVQVGHGRLHQRGGQRVAARGGQAERGGPGVALAPHAERDHDRLEGGGDDQGGDPHLERGVHAAAGRLGRGQATAQADRDQGHGPPGQRGQLAVGQLARHQQGERQLDDEDRLDQGDGTGVQRHGLGHRGQHHHGDPGQPDLAPDQVAEQRKMQRTVRGRGSGGHALQDRGQAVEQRCQQCEQNRYHCGILLRSIGPAESDVPAGHAD
jgi:hypothetical protein